MKRILIILSLICLSIVNQNFAVKFCNSDKDCLYPYSRCYKPDPDVAGYCKYAYCTKDSDCDKGFICQGDECLKSCKTQDDCKHWESCEGTGGRKYCIELQ